MGYVPQSTPNMGEYSVEVRSESFYLSGARGRTMEERKSGVRHGIELYPDPYPDGRQGTVELLIEDIPKLRASLDLVEEVHLANPSSAAERTRWVSFEGAGDDMVRVSGAPGADDDDSRSIEADVDISRWRDGGRWSGAWDIVSWEGRMRVHAVFDGTWSFAPAISGNGQLPMWSVHLEAGEEAGTVRLVIGAPDDAHVEAVLD